MLILLVALIVEGRSQNMSLHQREEPFDGKALKVVSIATPTMHAEFLEFYEAIYRGGILLLDLAGNI